MIYLGLFIFGCIWGSFINVVIFRLPQEKDVIFNRSECPKCHTVIPWYLNIPVISFVFLLGRCLFCKDKISIRYPFVELLSGLMCLYLGSLFILQNEYLLFFFYFFIFCALLAHFFIDIDHHLLLDKINLFLLALILPFVILFRPWTFWAYGGLIGFGVTYLVTWLFYLIRGQIGLGGGDIKLYGVLGLLLGPVGIIQNIFLSCFLGSIVGGTLILSGKHRRDEPMAFGPFIIIVGAFQILFPSQYHILIRGLGL